MRCIVWDGGKGLSHFLVKICKIQGICSIKRRRAYTPELNTPNTRRVKCLRKYKVAVRESGDMKEHPLCHPLMKDEKVKERDARREG